MIELHLTKMSKVARGAGLEGDEEFSFRNSPLRRLLDIQAVMSNGQLNTN